MAMKSGWLSLKFGKAALESGSSSPTASNDVWVELYNDRILTKKFRGEIKVGATSTESNDIRTVKVTKSQHGLDFSIKGGAEHGLPILISRIFENGAAAKTGQLNTGDMILEVNGTNLQGATHEQAVAALKSVDRVAVIKVKFNSQAGTNLTQGSLQKEVTQSRPADGQPPNPSQLTDFITIQLDKVLITRYDLKGDSKRPNAFIVRTLDGSNASEFTGVSEEEANEWFSAVNRVLQNLHLSHVGATVLKFVPDPFIGKIKRLGYLAERFENGWRYNFVVVTDYDINFYGATPKDINVVSRSIPLLQARLSLSPVAVDGRDHVFTLSSASGDLFYFAGETKDDYHNWTKLISSTSIRAVKSSDDISFVGKYKDRDVSIVCTLHDGIKLLKTGNSEQVWARKFKDLKSIASQEKKIAFTFSQSAGGSSVEEIQVDNPRTVLHALYNVYCCKVADIEVR